MRLATVLTILAVALLSTALSAQTLQNGHFTTPFVVTDSNTAVATSWTPYRLSANPQFKQSDFEQMPGGPGGQVSCQQIWADWSAFEAGVYQKVSGATIGQCYRLSGWLMSMFKFGDPTVTTLQDGNIFQRIGVDPYGGTDPNSTNVIWSWNDPMDKRWREIIVDAVAKSTTITVFARTKNLYAATNCCSFYDAFTLAPSNPITISNVKVRPGTNDAVVTWTTDVPSTGKADYGTYQGPTKATSSVQDSTLTTNHSLTLTGLNPGTQYFYVVRCTAPGKTETWLGLFTFTTLKGQMFPSLKQAKNNPDGTTVAVRDMVVSAATTQLSRMFFVQDQDRTSGIKVDRGLSTTAYAIGELLDVSGTLNTDSGDRRLLDVTITKLGQVTAPRPLAISNDSLGGVPSDQYTLSVPGSVGPNNSGLLVTVWGRMTYVSGTGRYCYIDDGSGLDDGTMAGRKGIKVYWYYTLGAINPLAGKYIRVTGLSSTFQDTNGVHPQIIVRSPRDLIQL